MRCGVEGNVKRPCTSMFFLSLGPVLIFFVFFSGIRGKMLLLLFIIPKYALII